MKLKSDYTRKAFYFDLSTQKLKNYFSKTNPNYAYTLIEKFMKEYNIEHRQYSGYVSICKMSNDNGVAICKSISKQFPWLHQCVERFDMTNVSETYDMIKHINEPYGEDYSTDEVEFEYPYLIEASDEYKLYKNQDETYTLFDEFDNEIGSTECDTIEDALEELQNQNDLSI